MRIVITFFISIFLLSTSMAGSLQCQAFYSDDFSSLQISEPTRARRLFIKAQQLPTSIKKLIAAKIDRENMTWKQLYDLHEGIMKKAAVIWTGGLVAYALGNLIRSHGFENWYSLHNSNFTAGVGMILTLDNALASLSPQHRKKTVALIYGTFGLANIAFETNWLGGGGRNDFGDLASAGAAIVMAAAIQYILEKNALIQTQETRQ